MRPQNDFQNCRPITAIGKSLFVFNGNFNGEMARFWIIFENDFKMIDLVLTHLNQPWGPPWTLATLGDHWQHGNFGHFQACRQWENALKAEVNIWDGNEILHWHALSHVLVVFPFKVHIATIINVVLECFLLPCLLLHLREPRQQTFSLTQVWVWNSVKINNIHFFPNWATKPRWSACCTNAADSTSVRKFRNSRQRCSICT